MDEVRALAHEHRPTVIIAGWSAYPRQLDFALFREIADEVGAKLWVDMAHFAGLVAVGLHPSPLPHAHIVTTTTHKTLGGPRGGAILTNDEEIAKKMRSAVFPGQQGGPLEHVIAAKAVAFKMALEPEFKERQERTIEGAKILADRLMAADTRAAGVNVLTGGTDVHLVLVDLRESELDGQQAEDRLHEVGITVNRNAVPNDPRPPMVTSGLRIGTPALATRGFGADEFTEVAEIIAAALLPGDIDTEGLRKRVTVLAERFPLYPDVAPFFFRRDLSTARLWLRPGLVGLHVFAVVAVAFCVFMGLWQLGVYDSRQEHEQADKREVPRVALSGLWGPDQPFEARLNHRPVTVQGTFAPASEQVWVTGKEQDGRTGAWLLAPLLVDGDALLVVRGWAPKVTDFPPCRLARSRSTRCSSPVRPAARRTTRTAARSARSASPR